MGKSRINNKRGVFIPNSKQFPSLPKPRKKAVRVIEKREPIEDVVLKNNSIDAKRLALLVNICHLVADVNEQFSMEISEMLKNVDPTLHLQFQRSITQIRNHASDMVRFVDTHTSEKFSEGFGETADALKGVIIDFFKDKTE